MDQEQLTLKQVTTILQVEPSTVRFWEKEFDEFLEQPEYKGQRKRFNQNSLDTLYKIKDLLQIEQYTIKGARRRLEMERALTSSLGIDNNFNATIFFMFSSIMEQLQNSQEEMTKLKKILAILSSEKLNIEEKMPENQNKKLFDYFKDKIQNKKAPSETSI